MATARDEVADRLQRIIALKKAALEYRETHARDFAPDWYDWQLEFFRASANCREVMLLAANQVGKTFPGTYALALDVTGDYPEWWPGCIIRYPVKAWALGVDATQTADVLQLKLLGLEGQDGIWRGGWIHHDEILDIDRGSIPGSVKRVYVRHKPTRGVSTLDFKAYRQANTGQKSLPMAGGIVDTMLVDEQPPDAILGQLRTRLLNGRKHRGGLLRFTLTPELGETDLITQFWESRDLVPKAGKDKRRSRYLVGPIEWARAKHLSPEVRADLLASYPEHEREMRSKGIPYYGSGKVFQFNEAQCVIKPFDIGERPWYRVIRCMDIGIDHPTAIGWLAYDPESRAYYVMRTFRQSDTRAAVHAATANAMWKNAPMVVPPDIDAREKGSGETVSALYRRAGLEQLRQFENPDGSRFVEPGLFEMQQAMSEGRFFVVEGDAQHFIEEARSYHRDDKGSIVKKRDDVIDAVRYGFQMIHRFGIPAAERETAGGMQGGLYPSLGLRRDEERNKSWQRHRKQ